MIGLTSRQAECLAFIEAHNAARGFTPSYSEMASALGYASKSTIYRLMTALEERGRIRRIVCRGQAIEVIEPVIAPRFRGVPLKFIPIHGLASNPKEQRDNG